MNHKQYEKRAGKRISESLNVHRHNLKATTIDLPRSVLHTHSSRALSADTNTDQLI